MQPLRIHPHFLILTCLNTTLTHSYLLPLVLTTLHCSVERYFWNTLRVPRCFFYELNIFGANKAPASSSISSQNYTVEEKKKLFLNLHLPDSHLHDGQVPLCFDYFLTNNLTFYSVTPYILSSRPSTLNDLTFSRDHIGVQKKPTQHCKAVILQLK